MSAAPRNAVITPCTCGATPAYVHTEHGSTNMLRLTCACGKKGAALLYVKPEDRAKMEQAGIDGWNIEMGNRKSLKVSDSIGKINDNTVISTAS